MLKKLSISKNQIFVIVLLAVAATGRAMAVMFRKGKPSVEALVFGVLACLTYAVLLAWDFPTKKEDFFTGRTVFRVLAAGVVFIGAVSDLYVNAAFNFILTLIAVIVFCSADIKLVPVAVVSALAVLVRYEPFAYAVIPVAIIVMLVLVAPGLKGSKSWEKIVFSGALISLVACLIYVIYQMRFIFSFSTFVTSLWKTVPLVLIAIVFLVCAALSLKEVRAPKAKKNNAKKNYAVKEKKADHLGAFAYASGAVFAFASAMLEGKYSMCCLVGLLTAMFVMCKNSTALQLVTDKIAGSALGTVDSLTKEDKE